MMPKGQCCLVFGRQRTASPSPFEHIIDKDEDAVLVKQMNAMSVKERGLVLDEIHGVDEVIEETKELIDTSIQRLKQHIDKSISKGSKKAYELACQMRPSMTSDEKFFLMWLRSTRFDPLSAARKICNHF